MRLKLVPSQTSINFMRHQKLALICSSFSLLPYRFICAIGLNLGIIRGGILRGIANSGPADIAKVRLQLKQLDLGDVSRRGFGTDRYFVRVQRQVGDEKPIVAIEKIGQTLGQNYDIGRTEFVGPTVGAELRKGHVGGGQRDFGDHGLYLVPLWNGSSHRSDYGVDA